MKIVLQPFEPQPQPTAARFEAAEIRPTRPLRKSRLRLVPVAAETRLFHAL